MEYPRPAQRQNDLAAKLNFSLTMAMYPYRTFDACASKRIGRPPTAAIESTTKRSHPSYFQIQRHDPTIEEHLLDPAEPTTDVARPESNDERLQQYKRYIEAISDIIDSGHRKNGDMVHGTVIQNLNTLIHQQTLRYQDMNKHYLRENKEKMRAYSANDRQNQRISDLEEHIQEFSKVKKTINDFIRGLLPGGINPDFLELDMALGALAENDHGLRELWKADKKSRDVMANWLNDLRKVWPANTEALLQATLHEDPELSFSSSEEEEEEEEEAEEE